MLLGDQIHAPRGFEALACGVVYHFLRSDERRNRVGLITFGAPVGPAAAESQRPKSAPRRPAPSLVYVSRDRFEEAIGVALIVPCEHPRNLPHWLGEATITGLRLHDQLDERRQRPHGLRIDSLLSHIWPAVQALDQILSADEPIFELNKLARTCTPVQNELRFRTAFFAYICFGMERLALHYPIANLGRWDRAAKDKKFGRDSVLGDQHGHSSCSAEVQHMCHEGYRRFSGPGKNMSDIYWETVTKIFGCVVHTDPDHRKRFVHPEGKPFVTEGQFVYRINQYFDLQTRRIVKYGEARVRNKMRVSQGKFSDAVANLMEVIEEDAYALDVVSQGYEEGSVLPVVHVVRLRCGASGLLTGIGFSIKGERAEAYRNAKACQAVDKVWYCSFYGVVITTDEWPSIGLPLHEITDRGPGATRGADSAVDSLRPMIKEIAPSYSGQSKASIETMNPKPVKREGAPHYKLTRLTIPQLAAQEIRRLIKDNLTTNVQSRLSARAIAAGTLPTPLGLWNYLAKLGRTFAYVPAREEAVRAFFTPVDLTIEDGAVFYMGFRFWSKEFRDSGLMEGGPGGRRQVRAYILETAVRQIILDTPNGLVTVYCVQGIRDGDEELLFSVVELEQLAAIRARGVAVLKVHRQAVKADTAQKFEAEFGLPYEQAQLRRGQAKRGNAASVDETRQIMHVLRARGGQR